MKLTKSKLEVRILTMHYMINGEITIDEDMRLSDYLDEAKGFKEFIAVTNAFVSDHDGKELFKSKFMNVHRRYIELIMPASMLVLKES